MTSVIVMIAAGVGFIAVIAIVVGIIDAARASAWRRVAAERRSQWEARQHEFHGTDAGWDDD